MAPPRSGRWRWARAPAPSGAPSPTSDTGQVIITESIVTRPSSNSGAHGPCLFDDSEEPGIAVAGSPRGGVALDLVIVVSRQGDRLVVEVTRRGRRGAAATHALYQSAGR